MNQKPLPQSLDKKSAGLFQIFSEDKNHRPDNYTEDSVDDKIDKTQQSEEKIIIKQSMNIQDSSVDNTDHQELQPQQQQQQQIKQYDEVAQNEIVQDEEDDGITKLIVKVSQIYTQVNEQLEPYIKGQEFQYPPTSAFKIIKIPKVYKRFFDYISGSIERCIILDGGWVYVVKKIKNDKFKVCSVTDLKLLQTILLTMKSEKHFFMIDFQNGKSKTYNFQMSTQWNLFLMKLNSEVQRLGLEIDNF